MTLIFQETEYKPGEYAEKVLGADGKIHVVGLLSRRRGFGGIVQHMGTTDRKVRATPPIKVGPQVDAPLGFRIAGGQQAKVRGR